jgi:hypothetical protein
MSHYSNNSTDNGKSQEIKTNFVKTKMMIAEAFKLNISAGTFRVLLYQIDQEFGHINDGQIKDGDMIDHDTRSRIIGIDEKTDDRATRILKDMNIFHIDKSFHVNNIYHINTDVSTWVVNKKKKRNEKKN